MSSNQREKLAGIVSVVALAIMVTIGIVEREQHARTSENMRESYSAVTSSDQFADMRDTCIKAYVEHDESKQATCATYTNNYLSDGETNGE